MAGQKSRLAPLLPHRGPWRTCPVFWTPAQSHGRLTHMVPSAPRKSVPTDSNIYPQLDVRNAQASVQPPQERPACLSPSGRAARLALQKRHGNATGAAGMLCKACIVTGRHARRNGNDRWRRCAKGSATAPSGQRAPYSRTGSRSASDGRLPSCGHGPHSLWAIQTRPRGIVPAFPAANGSLHRHPGPRVPRRKRAVLHCQQPTTQRVVTTAPPSTP